MPGTTAPLRARQAARLSPPSRAAEPAKPRVRAPAKPRVRAPAKATATAAYSTKGTVTAYLTDNQGAARAGHATESPPKPPYLWNFFSNW